MSLKRKSQDSTEWIYGIIPVAEALRARRRKVLEVWIVRGGRSARMDGLWETTGEAVVHETSRAELDRRYPGGRHQGVVARVEALPWVSLETILSREGPLLLLDGVQDPHNLGAIVRSAVALGAAGVVVEKRRTAPITPVVAKAASGALEHVQLCQVSNLPRTMRELKRRGLWMVGTTDRGGIPLWEMDWPGRVALVFGNEGTGLRPLVRAFSDMWVSIPTRGAVGTLNASVAAAVVLYEVMRQKGEGEKNRLTG
jgi:23S rRNA (guanosine2251-2'-O)-methyltransferase